jgi:hypothetical protein
VLEQQMPGVHRRKARAAQQPHHPGDREMGAMARHVEINRRSPPSRACQPCRSSAGWDPSVTAVPQSGQRRSTKRCPLRPGSEAETERQADSGPPQAGHASPLGTPAV